MYGIMRIAEPDTRYLGFYQQFHIALPPKLSYFFQVFKSDKVYY
jgi:hypothetical protein